LGVEKPVAFNHWLPWYGWRVEHAHTSNEQAVFQFLQDHKKALPGNLGGIVHEYSIRKIAIALEMAPPTVRDNLRSLVRKHSIIPWNVVAGTAQPRKRGDHGGTTSWRLPLFADVLRERRADPLIGTGGKSGKGFWVFGSGRRFLTPAEVVEWGIDKLFEEEKHRRLAAVRHAKEEDFAAPDVEVAAPVATTSPPAASPPAVNPLPVEVKGWLRNVSHNRCTPAVGREIVGKARAKASELGSAIADGEIVDLLRRIKHKAPKSTNFDNGTYFRASIAEEVEWWLGARAEELAQQALDAPRNAAFERNVRINNLVEWLKCEADPDPGMSEFAGNIAQWLAEADPSELDEARARFAERPLVRAAG
jgi:hypothetical protein